MGKSNANISRNMYEESKRYQLLVHQQGVPWVEADENDRNWIFFNLIRRLAQKIIGNGSPDNGFKIVGTGMANDFSIMGGDGTSEGAGRLLVEGFQCILPVSRNYKGSDNLECTPVSTGLAITMLTDSAANFTLGGPDENLAGRTLIPDITKPDKAYTIIANTKTGITVSGDMPADGIQAGAHYRIELSTSAADRTDEVYIDCYLDEIDGGEDPEIKHTLGVQIETQRRLKLIQNIFVAEGDTTPASYTDSDGNQHYTLKLATIQRHANQAAINAGDIADKRPVLDGDFWSLWQEVITVKNEVIAARGAMPSLDARLDVAMDENGELPEVVEARGSTPSLDSRLDVSMAEDGKLPEVVEARGTKPSLDERLDVSLNEDGTMKAGHSDLADMPDTGGVNSDHDVRYIRINGQWLEVVAARGVAPSLDARLDISLNEDGSLKASHADLADMPDPGGVNSDHDARYVKKSGDTMTGDLGMAAGKKVDGRDVSADGAKLDTIETGATQDQTPAEILAAIKTVDGPGSGLDADTVDGMHASDGIDNIEVKVYKVQGGTNVLSLLSGVRFKDGSPVSSLSQVRVYIAPADAGHDVALSASYNASSGGISTSHGCMVICHLKKNGWYVSGTSFSWNFNNYT